MAVQKRPFGLWNSPITSAMLSGSIRLNDVQWDSDGETLVWSERRSSGTVLVMQRGNDAPRDITDSSHKVGGRVLYGGGDFTVQEGLVIFVNEGHLYRVDLAGGVPRPITPKFGGAAVPRLSPDGEWVVFVHSVDDTDVLAVVDANGKNWPVILSQGTDFVMQPAWHPDSSEVAFITWDFPQMPFVGTTLHRLILSRETDGRPVVMEREIVAGNAETAIFQPEYSPDGRYLSYISDETGFGHIYLRDLSLQKTTQITSGEIEHIIPAWIQGMRTYGWTGDGSALYYIRQQKSFFSLWNYDVTHETSLRVGDLRDYTHLEQISVAANNEAIAVLGSASAVPKRVLRYSREDGLRVVRRSTNESIPDAYLATAQALTWTGHDGEAAHGLYYTPTNLDYEGLGTPPLMVLVHGGPTSQRPARYDEEVQFFTSRGYAVLQVNHRGSTGYGRAYMDKHKGNWGVYDVQDSITGAQHLVELGAADRDKLVIMGGSAGGYTVLQALVDAPGIFKAGIVSYGVANQFTLAMESHKFESRYNDWLLGPLPDAAEKYRDRSPLFHADKIQDALLLFHGTEDKVVPLNQSESIVAILKRRSIPHEFHIYEGEGHGFRKPETIRHFYETILRFLQIHVLYT